MAFAGLAHATDRELAKVVEFLKAENEFGEDHYRHLIESYVAYYNSSRPHQSLDNLPLDGHILKPPRDWKPDKLACTESLGGVLKSYSWKAAA
jgi:hypothetical protein